MRSKHQIQHLPSTQRIKTLQSPYSYGKNIKNASYKQPQRKIDQIIKSKLQAAPKTSRLHTLQNIDYPAHKSYINSIKLEPIKQGKSHKQDKEEDSKLDLPQYQDKKRSRLKIFFDNHAFLIQSWKNEQLAQKQRFKKKLKLAAIQSEKSIQRSLSKKQKQFKKSLKHFNEQPSKLGLSTKSLPKRYHLKQLQIRDSLQKSRLEDQTYKHSIRNLISLMEQNKKQLIKSHKHIKKHLKQQEDKSFKIESKKKLVKQIEDELLKEEQQRKQQKLQRYRRQLQQQLQQQIFLDKDKKNSSKVYVDPRQKNKQMKPSRNEQVNINPQKSSMLLQTDRQKSKSMVQINALQKSRQVDIEALTETEQQKCMKVIGDYQNQQNQELPARVFQK